LNDNYVRVASSLPIVHLTKERIWNFIQAEGDMMRIGLLTRLTALVLTLVLFVILLSACSQHEPIFTKLSFSKPPLLDKPVEIALTFRVESSYDRNVDNATAQIFLPPHIVYISGDLEWHGDMLKGQTYVIRAMVKSTRKGYFAILSRVIGYPVGNGSSELYVGVFENTARTYTNEELSHIIQGNPIERAEYSVPPGVR
jgi:hypothetical protein